MDTEKIKELMTNEEFVKKIVKMQIPEEVQSAFKENGVDISTQEVQILGSLINKSLEKGDEGLSDDDLSKIAGGKITKEKVKEFSKDFAKGFGEAFIKTTPYTIYRGIRDKRPGQAIGAAAASIVATAGALAVDGVAWGIYRYQKGKNS